MQRLPVRFGLTVLAGFLAFGLPLWPLTYREVSMGVKPLPAIWLALGSLAGFLGGYLLRPGWRDPILATALGFVLAVMVRVGLEVAADPTSHNLWPFEVVIAGFFGLVSGTIGVAIARGAQRITASK